MVCPEGRKRWASVAGAVKVIVGALLLPLVAWSYVLYYQHVNQEKATLASAPRLQIADFKRLYDGSLGLEDVQTSNRYRQQSANDLYIIDVRSYAQYTEGHIRRAVSVPEGDLEALIERVVPPFHSNALIVLYCA